MSKWKRKNLAAFKEDGANGNTNRVVPAASLKEKVL